MYYSKVSGACVSVRRSKKKDFFEVYVLLFSVHRSRVGFLFFEHSDSYRDCSVFSTVYMRCICLQQGIIVSVGYIFSVPVFIIFPYAVLKICNRLYYPGCMPGQGKDCFMGTAVIKVSNG